MNFIEITRKWIASFVVRYHLCPFAKHPLVNDKIHYVVYEGTDIEELISYLKEALEMLSKESPSVVETTFLIHPNILNNFYSYNDFLTIADQLIFALDLEGILQIASFHPKYQFGGTTEEDVTNYTNRSPFPMLHLLREESVEAALENYEDAESIPEKNMDTMQKLGKDKLLTILNGVNE